MNRRRHLLIFWAAFVIVSWVALPALANANLVPATMAGAVMATLSVDQLKPPQCSALGLISYEVVDVGGNASPGDSSLLLVPAGNTGKVNAGNGSDCVLAGSGNNNLSGKGGNDVLIGGDGNDTLDGGQGTDTCYGGPGNDSFDGCETCYSGGGIDSFSNDCIPPILP